MSNQALSQAFAADRLEPKAKLVLLTLADLADQNDECWPSRANLAARTGLSLYDVRRCLKALNSAGLIERTAGRPTELIRLFP